MNRFAELLDRLAYEPARNNKLRLITDYFRSTPDPERGWALAALTGALSFPHAKAGLIRSLIAERTDPVLFELSYDYVGDLSETVALMWPASPSLPLVGEGRGGGSGGRNVAGCRRARRSLTSRPPPLTPPHKGEGNSLSPPSSKRSPRSAKRNCRSNSRAGSMRSTRPGAGR